VRNSRFAVVMVLASVAVGLSASNSNAYVLEGVKWGGQPAPGHCCASITYRQFSSFSIDFSGFTNGANLYNNSVALVNMSTSNTDLIDARDTDNSSVSWDGQATYSSSGGFFVQPAKATLNHFYTKGYVSAEIATVAAHEFGHDMGLNHSSACVVMNPDTFTRYVSCGISYITTDDANGINALY